MSDFPQLGSVITTDDISTKGTGSYSADYINWCRVAHLLHLHAPGWQFHLRQTADGQHVWSAPNGTGYVVGYFTGPDGTVTPDFPQAVMDNRNGPVPMERISARDLTDSHRRCLCTAAAATFGLAWQLWAREEVENPMRDDGAAAQPAGTSASKAPVANKVKSLTPAPGASSKLTAAEIQELVNAVLKVSDEQRNTIVAAFQERFSLPADKKAADYIKTTAHRDFLMQKLHEVAS